jgi:beta-galactosidase GanA
MGAWHQWMADLVHDEAPDVPVHSKFINRTLTNRRGMVQNGIDPAQFTFTEINGNDTYNTPAEGVTGFMEYNAAYDLQRSLSEAPVFNSENHPIPNEDTNYEPWLADHVGLAHWQGMVHGQGASTMWVWRRTYDQEANAGAVGSILNRPDAVAAIGTTTLDANRLGEELVALQDVEPDVAILYSVANVVYSEDYLRSIFRPYAALQFGGQPVGFVDENSVEASGDAFADYAAIVLPGVTHLPRATLRGLVSYVQNGGSVVVLGDVPERDTRDQSLPSGPQETLATNAATLGIEADHGAIRSAVADAGVSAPISVGDADTGDPIKGVEYHSVTHDGRRLVNIANYTRDAATVTITADGTAVSPDRELIAAEPVAGTTLEVPALNAKLFAIEGL